MARRILGTIKRGKVKIYSKKQMAFLHRKKIDHTHFEYRGGRIIKKSRYVYKRK